MQEGLTQPHFKRKHLETTAVYICLNWGDLAVHIICLRAGPLLLKGVKDDGRLL